MIRRDWDQLRQLLKIQGVIPANQEPASPANLELALPQLVDHVSRLIEESRTTVTQVGHFLIFLSQYGISYSNKQLVLPPARNVCIPGQWALAVIAPHIK